MFTAVKRSEETAPCREETGRQASGTTSRSSLLRI